MAVVTGQISDGRASQGVGAFALALAPVLSPLILLAAGVAMAATVFVVAPLYIAVSVARALSRALFRRQG